MNEQNLSHLDKKYEETFFIKRPVLSTVISIFIVLAGVLAIRVLPVEQYPNLLSPIVSIKAQYPGATPEIMAATVASPIEQQVNGVDDMIYMSTTASSAGFIQTDVSFELGTDPDIATINVNNRVQAALNSLPEEVRRYGVTVQKASPSILQFLTISSPDEVYDIIYLSNYASINVIDKIKRLEGVSDATIFGAKDYSMRIWLDPERLQYFKLTPTDIALAVQQQNAQYSTGAIGSAPSPSFIEVTWQLNAQGRLVTPEEFRNIIIRTDSENGVLRLGDVANVELGAVSYDSTAAVNGDDSVPIAIYLAPGANALETADRVDAEMAKIAEDFPHGISYKVPYDTTLFVRISIEEVVHTLIEAMVLVFFVVYLFLQNWRATLIPCIAVPISIVGTFAGMLLFGFTINSLTLFGLVLAIGIVVDDAIVVLENVERILSEEKDLTVRQATAKAMHEVTGPVIAIVLVLSSVFIPVAFLGGLAGTMYQQFAITITISVVISGVVALTLTPSLCVILLKPHEHKPHILFRKFNYYFKILTNHFSDVVRRLMKTTLLTLGIFAAVCYGALQFFAIVPTEMLPNEDQGTVMAIVLGPEGTALEQTEKIIKQIGDKIVEIPGVSEVVSITGMNMMSNALASNAGAYFIQLDDWDVRADMGFDLQQFLGQLYGMGVQTPDVLLLPFMPPPIMGMSNTGGYEFFIQSAEGDPKELAKVASDFVTKANQNPALSQVSTTFNVNSPRIFIELDREKAIALGVNISDIFSTISASFASTYINDFNYLGRTFRVLMQAEESARSYPENLDRVYVRNMNNEMIPLTTLVEIKLDAGPQSIQRFNAFTAAKITGNPGAGYSSGQALAAVEDLADEILPPGYTIAWSGSSYQEVVTGGTDYGVFALGILMVLLILAAQYERWTLPLAVLSAIPFAIFGAIFTNWALGYTNNVYTQVAIITLLGLASKNAILIVEFAAELHREGLSLTESAIKAAKQRFRPIIMTSLAFILGCVPLAISSSAGAASRNSIGVSVIGGMLAATILAPLVVPFFFERIMALSQIFDKKFMHNNNEEKHNSH